MKRPVILSGFMGVGKTTVGQRLAARLGVGFVDLDQWIELKTGIETKDWFDGREEQFRVEEWSMLERVLCGPPLVIAVGGGTLLNPKHLLAARQKADIVTLEASIETIWSRIGGVSKRPLLPGSIEEAAGLKMARNLAYEGADVVLSTEGPLEVVVSRVEAWILTHQVSGLMRLHALMSREPGIGAIKTLQVPLGARSYDIEFMPGGRHHIGKRMRCLFPRAQKAAVVTNPVVGPLYLEEIKNSLEAAKFEVVCIEIPDGETAKSLSQVERVLDILMAQRFERREPLVALGGGVVGDLTGFVASIFLRGIPFVQVPTSLLAQVDSSVGGKTGVNSPRGKNLIGAFCQPRHVLIDVEVLETLAEDEYRSGLAEVVKYGAIRDVAFLRYLEDSQAALIAREPEIVQHTIFRSCVNKAEVVALDERENGERAKLNFGHTLGHCFEALGGYGGIKHGEAVSVGMLFAARLSASLGRCAPEIESRLKVLLEAFGLPTRAPACSSADCLDLMSLDKKVREGVIQFVLLEDLGRAVIEPMAAAQVRPVLQEFLELPA